MKTDSSSTVFVKLSSRSAKDAPATQLELIALYKKYIQEFSEVNDNNKLISLLKAQIDSFMV